MKNRNLFTLSFLLLVSIGFSQSKTIWLLDSASLEPIPFVTARVIPSKSEWSANDKGKISIDDAQLQFDNTLYSLSLKQACI